MNKVIFSISKKHLLARLKQSSIAALGVTFGIAAYIILMSFMTGLNGLLDGLILNRTPHVHLYNEIKPSNKQPIELNAAYKNYMHAVASVQPKQNLTRLHNALPMLSYLKKHPQVLGATPQIRGQVFYIGGAIEINGIVNGVDVMEEVRLFNLNDYIIKGAAQNLAQNDNGIILGAGIAKKMSLEMGDKIYVSTPKGNIVQLKIVGLYQSGLAEIDNTQSYANLATVQKILGEANNYITDINVKLKNIQEAPAFAKALSKMFDVTATDIEKANAQFETGSNIRMLISYAVSITLLIVAGFGIYNILNMMIYEKMNDIAILKATGFSGKDVKLIFITQAVTIGLVGGLLGLIVGYLVSLWIDSLPFVTDALPGIKTFPVNFNPLFYIIGITFALLSTFLAGYLPAKRAEKIDPVEILRGQ